MYIAIHYTKVHIIAQVLKAELDLDENCFSFISAIIIFCYSRKEIDGTCHTAWVIIRCEGGNMVLCISGDGLI